MNDGISNEQLARLRDHFQLCNDIDCPVCQLYGEGVNTLNRAWKKLKEGYLIVKIIHSEDFKQRDITEILDSKLIQSMTKYKADTAHIVDFESEVEIEGKKYPGIIMLEHSSKPYVKKLLEEIKGD